MKVPKEEDIKNVLAGDSTPDTAKDVAAWFATAEGSSYLESQIMSDFENPIIIDEAKISGESIPSDEILKDIQRKITHRRLFRLIGKVAAIFFPFLLLISTFLLLNTRIDLFGSLAYEEIYVPKGKNMQILFQDGSKAYLDSDTRLKYPKKFAFGKREVYLDGQGYFEVNSSKSWPFIVNLSGPSIKVLGTSFNVKAYSADEAITVRLDEGKIRMNTYSDHSYDMIPGEILTYNKTDKACSIQKINNLSDKSDWRHNVISFEDAPLKEVIKTLNREFDIDFDVMDSSAWAVHYTIAIHTNKLYDVLQELQYIAPLEFNYDQKKNIISIKYQEK